MINDTISSVRARLPEFISEKRMAHTLAVAEEAKKLGKIYGLSSDECEKLYLAGLLHDITKECKLDRHLEICEKHGELWTDDDIKSPKVFHSVTGALLAKELYPELSDDILLAIRSHTTGRAGMELYEKLLYLADYIEETRTFPDCVELRKKFYSVEEFTLEHLNRVLFLSFNMTLSSLINDGHYIHPKTVAARNYLIKELD